MIRSGSTLQYNIVRTLVERMSVGRGYGFYGNNPYFPRPPFNKISRILHNLLKNNALQAQLFQWGKEKSFHVIKMHEIPSNIEKMADIGLMQTFYIYRDIRDVAVSVKRIWKLTGNYLLNALDKAILNYYTLRNLPNVLYQRYEELIADIPNAIHESADFLGLKPTNTIIRSIATAVSPRRMKKIANRQIKAPWRAIGSKKTDTGTLLLHKHISDNKVRKSRHYLLKKKEAEIITNRYQNWLLELEYPI